MSELIKQKFIITGIILVVTFLIAKIIRYYINKRIKNINDKHLYRRSVYYIMTFINIMALLVIWIESKAYVVTVLGLGSAGLALALHPVIMGIAGWLYIIIKKPYTIGDRIEIDKITGDVIDIKMFSTIMLEIGNWISANQSTGRIVHVPNGKIFAGATYNYTRGFNGVWNEIKILITFESDKDLAEKIIIDIANNNISEKLQERIIKQQKKLSKKYAIKAGKLTPITYFTIQESGVQIELRYLTSSRGQRYMSNIINREIYEAFSKEKNIEFAYPSQQIYLKNK